jgi:hypothetical protein
MQVAEAVGFHKILMMGSSEKNREGLLPYLITMCGRR